MSHKKTYTFKAAALKILKNAGEPLHASEIIKRALDQGIIETGGLTPEATVNARIITDINALGERSAFVKVAPATYAANKKISVNESEAIDKNIEKARSMAINTSVSSGQKGSIAEARIAELIVLYGDSGLSCYKPISDDEGIDIIVKQRGSLKTLYLQVKSRWNSAGDTMIADVKKSSLTDSYAMGVVVCRFDVDEGDVADYLWFIPAPDFIRLAEDNGTRYRLRTVKHDDKWDEYMIDRRDLANRLIEQMKRV